MFANCKAYYHTSYYKEVGLFLLHIRLDASNQLTVWDKDGPFVIYLLVPHRPSLTLNNG